MYANAALGQQSMTEKPVIWAVCSNLTKAPMQAGHGHCSVQDLSICMLLFLESTWLSLAGMTICKHDH